MARACCESTLTLVSHRKAHLFPFSHSFDHSCLWCNAGQRSASFLVRCSIQSGGLDMLPSSLTKYLTPVMTGLFCIRQCQRPTPPRVLDGKPMTSREDGGVPLPPPAESRGTGPPHPVFLTSGENGFNFFGAFVPPPPYIGGAELKKHPFGVIPNE